MCIAEIGNALGFVRMTRQAVLRAAGSGAALAGATPDTPPADTPAPAAELACQLAALADGAAAREATGACASQALA